MAVRDGSKDDGFRQVDLVATPGTGVVAGRSVELLTYNGAFPGPLMRFREGDRVRVLLTNLLGEPTNLHFHGLHIPPAADDPFRLVPDGDTIVYEFELLAGSAGTYWYHPHGHGEVSTQLFAGLAGPLIVDGDEGVTGLADAEEQIVVVKDLAIDGQRVSPHTADDWLNGKEGELILVNGELQPHLTVPSGRLRLRVINASNARYFLLGIEGHQLTVLGAGNGFAEEPSTVDTVLLSPAERTDVLVAFQGTSDFELVAHPYDRGADMSGMDNAEYARGMGTGMRGMDMGGMDDSERTGEVETKMSGMNMGGMGHMGARPRLGNRQPITLATFTATRSAPQLRLPEPLASFPPLYPTDAIGRRQIVLSEDMGRRPVRFLINGKAFEHGRIDFHSQRGSLEVWEVINDADMDHPFHLHSYPFIVLSRNGQREEIRMWRDTINTTPGGQVELLVPFHDFTGTTMYHCHIVEHEDRGMMALFEVDPLGATSTADR